MSSEAHVGWRIFFACVATSITLLAVIQLALQESNCAAFPFHKNSTDGTIYLRSNIKGIVFNQAGVLPQISAEALSKSDVFVQLPDLVLLPNGFAFKVFPFTLFSRVFRSRAFF